MNIRLERALEKTLLTQISLEERIYKDVERQMSQSNIDEFPEVKAILNDVKEVLEKHFVRLNLALEQRTERVTKMLKTAKGDQAISDLEKVEKNTSRIRRERLSKMLHDDYAALNFAAMGNTVLHSTALAADSHEIAGLAQEHLGNLSRSVVMISEVVPKVVTQELSSKISGIKPGINGSRPK